MVGSEPRSPSSPDHVREGNRLLAVLVTLILLLALTPVLPLAGAQEGSGYLVFRDTQQVGPDLDVVFHVVVPEDADILSATLDLYGTRGVMPVDTATEEGGEHSHSLTVEGLHGHQVEDNAGHDHDILPSGEHTHDVYVYPTVQDLNDSRMDVTLPGHTHTYNGFTWVVDDYVFPATVSNGHNHTADPHEHSTLILDSGDHGHVAEEGGDHLHTTTEAGAHLHNSSTDGFHDHPLNPGWSMVGDGTRPSGVEVTFSIDQSTDTLPGTFGDSGADWHESIGVSGNLIAGLTEVSITSLTEGSLEYVLTVEVDGPYGVISGHSPIGREGRLRLPLFAPPDTVSARLYLFGDDLPMVVNSTLAGGDHTHAASAAGDHRHTVDPVGDHSHLVSGGDHEHNGTVSSAAPTTTSTEPYWFLPGHRHDLTWNGNQVTAMGGHSYGTVQSTDHNHTVNGHDHTVSLNVSGNHSHDLTWEGVHTHTSSDTGIHTHDVVDSGPHDHQLVYSPTTSSTGPPRSVVVEVDDDTTPHLLFLESSHDELDLNITDWEAPHFLNLTSPHLGEVEWVVLLTLSTPAVVASVHGLAGEVMAHIPTPGSVAGARVGVLGSEYIMPLAKDTEVGGLHDHVTDVNGSHLHTTTVDGAHDHTLLSGDLHGHRLTLEATAIQVEDANATIDLGGHTHTIQQNAFMTSSTSIGANTGDHSHGTVAHDHGLQWDTAGDHVHTANMAGNHTHEMVANGTHDHALQSSGTHDHEVVAGVGWKDWYPNLTDLNVKLGEHPGVDLQGGAPGWWEEFTVLGAALSTGDMQAFDASAGGLGTLSAVVWFILDLDPPVPVLISAREWVRPANPFPVLVGFPDDVDPTTIDLEIGPIEVDDSAFDDVNFTMNFTCSVPEGAAEGRYDINVYAEDMAGNSATTTLGSLGIDLTPPVVTAEVGQPNVPGNGFTWVTSRTPVTINITDGLSGPAKAMYAFSADGPWTLYDPSNDTILDGRPEGAAQLFYVGYDKAGNVQWPGNMDLKIDDTAPYSLCLVEPSRPNPDNASVAASIGSLVSFWVSEGSGVGKGPLEYRIVRGAAEGDWGLYDRPFPVSEIEDTGGGAFTIEWRVEDLLGNGDATYQTKEVTVDTTPPVPSPEGDLHFPTHVTTSPVTVYGHIPGDVANLLYGLGDGYYGSINIEPDTTFDFDLPLKEGSNTLLYALEDRAGNRSPWVIAGTIVLDKEPPEVVGTSPVAETVGNAVKGLAVIVQFSEPVTNLSVTAKGGGNDLDLQTEMGPGGNSVTVTFDEDLPSSKWIDMALTFDDMAGRSGEHGFRFKTGSTAEESTMGYLWGLVAGLVIGAILVFFITFNRREGDEEGVEARDLQVGEGIIQPESQFKWTPEEREEEEEEEEEEDLEEDEEDEDLEEDLEEEEGYEEPKRTEEPEKHGWAEGDIEEEEMPREPEEEEEVGDESSDEIDELMDELDDLLGGSEDPEDLPDPDEPTVDPGPRF